MGFDEPDSNSAAENGIRSGADANGQVSNKSESRSSVSPLVLGVFGLLVVVILALIGWIVFGQSDKSSSELPSPNSVPEQQPQQAPKTDTPTETPTAPEEPQEDLPVPNSGNGSEKPEGLPDLNELPDLPPLDSLPPPVDGLPETPEAPVESELPELPDLFELPVLPEVPDLPVLPDAS
ncbi:MAG: hypothetical protein HWE20_12140 [Gammaproteobacteria bacterium]|nr:hypothetical protein [Gammaproteobacteria bacterium]